MASASLALNVTAHDETGGALEEISGKVDGISKAAKLMGEAFAVEQVFDFGKDIVNAGQTAISTMNSTKQAIADAGLPEEMAKQVQEASEKLGALAGVTGVDMQQAFNAGLAGSQTFAAGLQSGSISVDDFTQAVSDMSSKVTDGQNTTQSLTAASKALGKAMNDPASGAAGLKREQVNLTAAQIAAIKATEKQNGVAAAQKLLMEDVSSAVKGQTDATVPATAKMAASWENLKEQLGVALIPVINKLMAILSGVMSFISAHIGVITDLAQVLIPAAAAFMAVKVAIDATKMATELLEVVFKDGSITTMGWVGIVVLVAMALVEAYEKSQTFRDIVKTVIDDVSGFFEGFWHVVQTVFGAISSAASAVVGFVKDHWQIIVGFLGGPVALAIAEIATHFSAIKDAIGAVWDWIYNKIKAVVGAVMAVIQPMIDAFNKVTGFASGVVGKVGSVLGDLNPFATGGVVGSGGYAIVGENGPEIVALPSGSTVIPNGAASVASRDWGGSMRSASVRTMGPSSSGTAAGGALVIQVDGNSNDLLVQMLRNQIRKQGGNVQKVLGGGN